MAEEEHDVVAARSRLLGLLEGVGFGWEFSERARRDGKIALKWLRKRDPTELEMVEFVIAVLKTSAALRCAPQGDPPGSAGIAWQLTDARNIFIKLRICEHRIGQEFAYIQRLHESDHVK